MAKPHDIGGRPTDEPIDQSEHRIEDWERRVDALVYLLGRGGTLSVDQLRRAIESLEQGDYEALSYYERWAAGLETLLTEKGVLTADAIDRRAGEIAERWRTR